MPECRYLTAPAEAEVLGADGGPVLSPPRDLCAWAIYHPASADKLTDTPPWLVRNAVAGPLVRRGDCDRCLGFEPGAPVEGAR